MTTKEYAVNCGIILSEIVTHRMGCTGSFMLDCILPVCIKNCIHYERELSEPSKEVGDPN